MKRIIRAAKQEPLSSNAFHKFFPENTPDDIKLWAGHILYRWYKQEGSESMPTSKSDVLDMLDAATSTIDKRIVSRALFNK